MDEHLFKKKIVVTIHLVKERNYVLCNFDQ